VSDDPQSVIPSSEPDHLLQRNEELSERVKQIIVRGDRTSAKAIATIKAAERTCADAQALLRELGKPR